MKKILEVLQYSDIDLRFNTDVEVSKNPNIVPETISRAAFTMVTKLRGGNELSVLAMIRALAIADLAVSVNREEMVQFLDDASADMAKVMVEVRREFVKNGGKIVPFPPGVKPSKGRS